MNKMTVEPGIKLLAMTFKMIIAAGLISFFTSSCQHKLAAQNSDPINIYISAEPDKDVLEAVNDLKYWLERAGIKRIYLHENTKPEAKGIFLVDISRSDLSKQTKQNLQNDGQTFHLMAKSYKDAVITATGKNSFINGIYTFLFELGFRWYMPGDTWAIIPAELPVNLNINKVYSPDFRDRIYAGSGGLNVVPGVDETNQARKDYALWNRRNRFSADYPTRSHAGQDFYRSNKIILDKNPAYFCNGKLNKYGRINISNPGAVSLFVKWALSQVQPNQRFPLIGVDPADGAGGKDDCLPTGNPMVKTWSDKYFWLANKVAEQLPADDHKTMVQLYAYSRHTDTPRFTIHKNVFPIIIPYAFQSITTPEAFINRWHQKLDGRAMGIYDYWNITQWSVGLPQFNIYTIPEKLRLWKKHHIKHINIETTNAKGPMGHALWLSSQMMWNVGMSFDSLYHSFLQDCFGPAKDDVKRMYDRWSRNYQEAMEVNLSLHDLEMASSKTNDQKILNRITELKAYINYMRLYYKYKNDKTEKNYEALIQYMYLVHPLEILQTSALKDYYIAKPKNYNKVFDSKKNLPKSSKEIYEAVDKITSDERDTYRDTYHISSINFDIARAKPSNTPEKGANPRYLTGNNQYEFYLPGTRKVHFEVGATKNTVFRILDEQKNIILEKTLSGTKNAYHSVDVQLKKGKYIISFGEYYMFSRIQFPADIVFFRKGVRNYDNAGYPEQYFYVPADVDAIIYQDNLGPGINNKGYWVNPEGKRIDPKKISGDIYKIPVPVQFKGKVWKLVIGHPSYKMLNIPDYASLSNLLYFE